MKIKKIFGPPGSGKTTYLLNIVEQELAAGVPASSIGYFAFTRKAANEAKERAIARFPHLNQETDFPWFRTLHSLAYKCLGINQKDMMSSEHYAEFAKQVGIEVNTSSVDDFTIKADHPILNEINIARIRNEDLRVYYNRSSLNIEWHHFEYIDRAYRHYKNAKNLIDFTDLIQNLLNEPDRLPSLHTIIIDEAQDLSLLQWKLVEELASRSQVTYLAGDDDQAVYTWAGADVASFLNLPGEIQVLDQSYRVPQSVHDLATNVVNRIRNRQEKAWKPREFDGLVCTYNVYTQVDITQGQWLILASTNYILNDIAPWVRSQGLLYERNGHRSISESNLLAVVGWEMLRKGKAINYNSLKSVYQYLDSSLVAKGHKRLTAADPNRHYDAETLIKDHGLAGCDLIWHEALTKISDLNRDYIIAMLRRGTRLLSTPPIRLSTIHGAKGGEADNVLLVMDLSPRFMADHAHSPDDLNRLLYVGITRAKQTLHLVLPKDNSKGFLI
jgi:DNA helicase-2/ATP-dependent DNA helicase PcrA